MQQIIDRSFIGEGIVHARLYGTQDPLLPFGNCDIFNISFATDRKALPNYMGGGGNRNVRERVTDVTSSVGFYDLTPENIALVTRSTIQMAPTAAIPDEAHVSKGVALELIPFKYLPDLTKTVVVKTAGGDPLEVGTDYQLVPHGIQVLSGGYIDATGITVSYTPRPSSVVQMLNGSQKELELYVAGLNDAQSGEPFTLRARRVKFGMLQEFAVLGQEYAKLTGPAELLSDPLVTAAGISKFCQMDLVEPA